MRLPVILNIFFLLNLKSFCYLTQTFGWAVPCLLSMSSVGISTTNPLSGLSWHQSLSIILNVRKGKHECHSSVERAAVKGEGKHRRQQSLGKGW